MFSDASRAAGAKADNRFVAPRPAAGRIVIGLNLCYTARPPTTDRGNLLDAHLPAPQVNPGVRGHQLHDGAVSGEEQVFDRGAPSGYADFGDFSGVAFDAAEPPAANYCTDLGRGLLKINGDPVGQVTFGLKGDSAGGYVETSGPVLTRILAKAGVPAGRIGASIASLASAAVVGAWFGDPVAARDAVGWVARSALAAVLPDREGVWGASVLTAPGSEPDHTIDLEELVDIADDETAPGPVAEVRVGWGRVWTTFRGQDLAPALRGTPAEERLAAEYRVAIATDAEVKDRFPRTWRALRIDTALREEADAQALADTLKALFGLRDDGAPRRMWRVTLELTAERLATPLGATVRLIYPPAGLDDRYLLVAEELLRPQREQVIWTLWG